MPESRFGIGLRQTALAAAFLFLVSAGSATACSCVPPGEWQDNFDGADLILQGEVKGLEQLPRPMQTLENGAVVPAGQAQTKVTFITSATWKGEGEKELTVLTPTNTMTGCGVAFVVGTPYALYLRRGEDGTLNINKCRRVVTDVEGEIDLLPPPTWTPPDHDAGERPLGQSGD